MTADQLAGLLAELAAVVLVAKALGLVSARFGQPSVIAEVLLGVLIGPTILHGTIGGAVFPIELRPTLTALSNLGVVLFMFMIGLEMKPRVVDRRTAISTWVGSMLVPGVMGALLAVGLAAQWGLQHRTAFVVFMGAALSVTAFPVLARILSDRGMEETRIGQLGLASAGLTDAAAWILLAVAIVVAASHSSTSWRVVLLLPYLAVMLGVIRPLLSRALLNDRLDGVVPGGTLALLLALLLISAAVTSWIGLHPISGAFLLGVLTPRKLGAAASQRYSETMGELARILLLPLYFLMAGLQVNLAGLAHDRNAVLDLVMILAVAIVGKLAGTFLPVRASGLSRRDAATLAVLMNTRGLTELIILGVGLQLKIIDSDCYSLMVVMTLITTAMTGPLLSLLYPRARVMAAIADARADADGVGLIQVTGAA